MTTKMNKKKIDEQLFAKIKGLLSSGFSYKEVGDILGKHHHTVATINNCIDLDQYKEIVKNRALKKHNRKEKIKYLCPNCNRDCGSQMTLGLHLKKCKVVQLKLDEPVDQNTEAPIYDVLVQIRDEISDLNTYLKAVGKSKSFKLW